MRKAGINMERVKKENRSLIIKCINDAGPLSRKDIAVRTQLTPASVTQITTQLISEGILIELGSVQEDNPAVGRKKVLLDFNSEYCYVLSINIEPKETTVAICDIRGNLKDITHLTTDNATNPETFLKRVARAASSLMSSLPLPVKSLIKYASVGITGIVDKERGVSVHAYGIWDKEVNITRILQDELGISIYLENNVDAFSRAEILFGTGRSYDSLLIIKWGPGVGSAFVIDGAVYEGRHGKTAELGHLIVEKGGKKCTCGRHGCLETLLSYDALSKIISFNAEEFEKTYLAGTEAQRAAVDSAIDIFARSIVNTSTIIAPNRIVLSGALFSGSAIRSKLIEACRSYDPSYDSNRIIYTELSSRESYIGPVAVCLSHLLQL